jgi:DNA-binding GntR family transcriptional regulator
MAARKHPVAGKSSSQKLDSRSLYESCADVLSREIAQGTLQPGQRLASERSLADTLGFTRLTVRRALQELAERGLLAPDERRGWQVRGGPVSESLNTLVGFTQMAHQRGLVATSRILALEYREATIDEAETLRVAAGTPMLDLSRLRLLDERPTAIERLRMAVSRVRWPSKFDFRGSIYAALESQGVFPKRAEAFVEVVDATAADAELLGVIVGRGLLCINCVTARADGLAFSLETTKYHPDRYRFRAILERRAEH